jgi:integrase
MSVTPETKETDMPTGLLKREGRYSTRRIIPLDLQAHYGRREIVKALGTSNIAEAKRLHARMNVTLDDDFAAARAALLVDTVHAPEPAPLVDPAPVAAKMLELLRRKRATAAAEGKLEEFKSYLGHQLFMHQAVLDGHEEPINWSLEEHEGIRNGLRAMLTGEGAMSIPAPAAVPKSAAKGTSLSELVELWIKHQARIRPTVASMWRVTGRLERIIGQKTVEGITRRDIATFVDRMREPGAETKTGHSIANMNAMLSLLSALFGLAVKRNLIESNPAANMQIEDTRRAREKRKDFDVPALTAIFGSPVYKDGLRPNKGAGEAAYWVPLLALYTGARINELCQLHPDNVLQEGYSDPDGKQLSAWVIRIEDNKARGQRVKTEGSERRIPVHADLIKLGFLDYAKRQKGKALLFDALKMNNQDGRISGAWGQWFSEYLRGTCGVADKKMTFHSFRHTFKHHARGALIPEDVHNALTGHETGDAARDYGGLSYPLHPLVEGMKRYRVQNFTLPAPPPGLPA